MNKRFNASVPLALIDIQPALLQRNIRLLGNHLVARQDKPQFEVKL